MDMIIRIMLVIFPILMYLVFSCYDILTNKKMERIIFIITIMTSFYFSLYNVPDNSILLIFCNIPILVCYLKKEPLLAIILSLILIIVFYFSDNTIIYITICKHIGYLITYMLIYKKKYFNSLFLKLASVIQGFFISFEYFMTYDNGMNKIFNLIFLTMLGYLVTFFCLYLFKLADKISKICNSINKVQEENKIKNSLFKLTHEIKNPLAVCKGYLDMMEINNVDKSRKYVEIISSEIARSLNIMNDYMEYSKIKINKEIIDIGIMMDELYDSFKVLGNGKNITFNYQNNYDEIYVWGDYERLKQVFVNVIKNSIESIIDKGIIDIEVCLNKKDAIIKIKDNGVGMSKEELDNIGEMFYTTKKNGTGLGVSLSKEIVLAHNGTIKYNSVKNQGTECIVRIPL